MLSGFTSVTLTASELLMLHYLCHFPMIHSLSSDYVISSPLSLISVCKHPYFQLTILFLLLRKVYHQLEIFQKLLLLQYSPTWIMKPTFFPPSPVTFDEYSYQRPITLLVRQTSSRLVYSMRLISPIILPFLSWIIKFSLSTGSFFIKIQICPSSLPPCVSVCIKPTFS